MSHPVVSLLMRTGAIRFGSFTLKSGESSPIFIDLGRVADGESIHELGLAFARGMATWFPNATHLFGPAYKGISLASGAAVGMALLGRNIRTFFDRKEAKDHGEGGIYIGSLPDAQSRVVVIDDVTTSGATKVQAFAAIEQTFGARPEGVLVAVDRSRGKAQRELASYGIRALVTLTDVATHLEQIGATEASAIRAYAEALG